MNRDRSISFLKIIKKKTVPVHKKRDSLFALPSKKYLLDVRFINVTKNFHMMSYEYLKGEHPTFKKIICSIDFGKQIIVDYTIAESSNDHLMFPKLVNMFH